MLADVVVERIDPVTVALRWSWIGTRQAQVAVTTSTVLPDESPPADIVVTGEDEVFLEVPPVPRHLFTVRPPEGPAVVVAERRIPVEGTLNFRDLGGYHGRDGLPVRWGRVYRSDNLAGVGDEGWASLISLGLRSVYDLRHESERLRAPTVVPSGLSSTHLPIGGEAAEAADLIALVSGDPARFGLEFMVEMNRTLLREHAAVWGRLLAELADTTHLPAVFHCTAGKDRTGVAAALLLGALGVDREAILDDYELTTRYRSRHRIAQLRPQLEASGVDVERVRPFLTAPRPALAQALAEVDRDYGGIVDYLSEACRVESAVLDRLRAELLDVGGTGGR